MEIFCNKFLNRRFLNICSCLKLAIFLIECFFILNIELRYFERIFLIECFLLYINVNLYLYKHFFKSLSNKNGESTHFIVFFIYYK